VGVCEGVIEWMFMRFFIECLLNDNHQKGKMMIMIMETSRSQVVRVGFFIEN